MGDLDLSALREEVKAAHANRSDITDARYDRAINLSQRRIARIHKWSDLYWEYEIDIPHTGAPRDDRFVEINSQIHKILSLIRIDLTSNETDPMEKITTSQMADLVEHRGLDNTGEPFYYAVLGNSPDNTGAAKKFIEIFRPPDQAYKGLLRVFRYPTKLVNDTDVSDFHSLDDAIIALSASWLYATLREMDSANKWFRIFRNEIETAVDDDNSPGRMEVSGEGQVVSPPEYWKDPFIHSMSQVR